MQQPDWKYTAIIITYDDSDGWYDHAYVTPTTSSYGALDALERRRTPAAPALSRMALNGKPVHGRCGPGTRIPFLVISPWAKQNYVSHTLLNQASVVQFIEDNWLSGERLGGGSFDATAGSIMDMFNFSTGHATAPELLLDPTTGTTSGTR